MLRKNKNIKQFRSYTSINNYNKFLMDLDKKHSLKKEEEEETKENICKKNIVPKINTELLGPHMTGLSRFDLLLNVIETNLGKSLDPNVYASDNDNDKTNIQTTDTNNSKNNSNYTSKNITKKYVIIDVSISNINDLLKLTELYPDDISVEYNINMSILHKIKEPLSNLNRMIGMSKLKEDIVDQILFYMQNLHTSSTNDFMHTVIYGPPGTGKTEIAKIVGSIFSKMGILSKGTFKKVTRSDLIAGYLGQTALKTRDVIKESLGGVLFIDEAYALGNEEKRDSFSKECIDTLCECASDHKENLMIIIAGYEEELDKCFFSYNAGLDSRFSWRFKTEGYNGIELYNIFLKKLEDGKWTLMEDSKIDSTWFEKNKDKFKFYGRDIETLFAKTKIAHSRRIFGKNDDFKKKFTIEDLDKGLEIFSKNLSKNKGKEDDEKLKRLMATMYI